MARSVVHSMHGQIVINSEKDVGTKVSLISALNPFRVRFLILLQISSSGHGHLELGIAPAVGSAPNRVRKRPRRRLRRSPRMRPSSRSLEAEEGGSSSSVELRRLVPLPFISGLFGSHQRPYRHRRRIGSTLFNPPTSSHRPHLRSAFFVESARTRLHAETAWTDQARDRSTSSPSPP